jgi:hypothetical protein
VIARAAARVLSRSSNASGIEGMIDQALHPLDEPVGIRQCRVHFECRVIDPTRLDKERPRVSDGRERRDIEASWFAPRNFDLFSQGLGDSSSRSLREHEIGQ